MYPVSTEFKEKILAPIRQVFAKVQIDYTDPFLDQSIEVEANENANISKPEQTADGIDNPSEKIASLDGSWELDGTYSLVNDDSHIGWWGKQLSDESGEFAEPYPTLIVTFQSRPIYQLKVVGDNKREEYPVNFTINLYNSNNELLYQEIVDDNSEVKWQKSIDTVINVVKMELIITKWSHPGRQAKIAEFFTSIQGIYENEDIVSINLLEERDVSAEGIPYGNISSNQIALELRNDDKKFSAGNIWSSLKDLLKPNRRIRAWLGIEKDDGTKEYVPLGHFWSEDWTTTKDGLVAKVTGRDRFKFLEESTYENEEALKKITLYDLAENIILDAGLSEGEYWIDGSLKDIIVPYVKLKCSHREALEKVVQVCLGQCYFDRNGLLKLEGPKQSSDVYTINVSENANISYPSQLTDGIEIPDALVASLDGTWNLDDDYILAPTDGSIQMGWWGSQLSDENGEFSEPYPTITLEFLSKAIEAIKIVGDELRGEYPVDYTVNIYAGDELVATHDIEDNTEVSNTVSIPENPTNATKIEVIIKKWSHPNRQAKILEYIDVIDKTLITPSDYFKKSNPANYSEIANYIVVTVKQYDEGGDELDDIQCIAKDDESITQNGLIKFEFPENELIQTTEIGQKIADTLLRNFKDPRRNLELEWRGNPALMLGNIVEVQDEYEANKYKVVRQEFNYAGYLRSKLEGRRYIE